MTGLCDDAPPPHDVWTGKGQIGYVSSQGNTQARTANAAIDLTYSTADWQHTVHAGGLYARSLGVTSGERWDALWQSNYDVTRRLYTFAGLRYERDLFSGFQFQASATVGLGYRIFDTKDTQLSIQVGPGFREERPQVLMADADGRVTGRLVGGTTGSGIGSASLTYSQNLTPTTTIGDKLLVESGGGNTLYTNQLTLTLKATNRLAVSLGYSIQDNTAPPVGQKKLDSTQTVNLVFSL